MLKIQFLATVALILVSSSFIVSCGSNNGEEETDTTQFGSSFAPWADHPGIETRGEKNFAFLINNYAESRPTHDPWASTYWPYTGNGIANPSWSGGGSPAGKYDAAHGGTTHSQEWEVKNHGSKVPKVQGWWGHCNGWSAAASLFKEPPPSMRVNGVNFTRADIKGLLTEVGMLASADYFGEKVDPIFGADTDSPNYQDIAPDQYFLVLTNYMGAKKMAINVDEFTGNEIWNQPVAAYRIKYPKPEDYLGADPQAPNVYRINMTSTLYWANDSVSPSEETPPFVFEDNAFYTSRTLNSEIWLDAPVVFGADGKITSAGNVIVTRHPNGRNFIGGNWHDQNMYPHGHPDFIWIPFSLMDARDPELNHPDDPNANPEIYYQWLVDHFINGAPDDPGVIAGPIPSVPPSGRPDPESSHTPNPFPTFPSFPTHTPTPIVTPNPIPTQPIPRPRPTPGPGMAF